MVINMEMITKIGVWGDSILKGVILDDAAGRYRLMKDGAVNCFAKLFHMDVSNHSHFGCTAPKALANLDRSIERGLDEDLILLEFGGNDCDYNWSAVSADPGGLHMPNTPYVSFIDSVQKMISTLLARGIRPVLTNLPPIDAYRYFDWITSQEGIDRENILSFLGEKEYIYRHQEKYSAAMERLAYANNLVILNVREAFLDERRLGNCLCADGIHPNEKGQALIQGVFAKRYQLYLHS